MRSPIDRQRRRTSDALTLRDVDCGRGLRTAPLAVVSPFNRVVRKRSFKEASEGGRVVHACACDLLDLPPAS